MNKTLLPEQIAKLERKCLATEDGAKAIQEVAERSVAVRENMTRLRALRLANEAREIAAENRAATVKKRWGLLSVRASVLVPEIRRTDYARERRAAAHSIAIGADRWPDDLRLSELRFVCKACGKRGVDVRPDFNWNKTPAAWWGIGEPLLGARQRQQEYP
jgi:hypothetical protein